MSKTDKEQPYKRATFSDEERLKVDVEIINEQDVEQEVIDEEYAVKSSIIKSLNIVLSSICVLRANVHAVHWNVESPDFIPLHIHMDEIYDQLSEFIDVSAELIRMQGKYPVIGFTEFLINSVIAEITLDESINRRSALMILEEGFKQMTRLGEKLFVETSAIADINGFATDLVTYSKKESWFLNSSNK